jgi:hypothetical protein
VGDFLALRRIEVVGISRNRQTRCDANCGKFKPAGYRVLGASPPTGALVGCRHISDLKCLPQSPDGAFVPANRGAADQGVRQFLEIVVGQARVATHAGHRTRLASGTTSVSPAASDPDRHSGN